MSSAARRAFFVLVSLVVVVLFLHSPWTGYQTEIPAPHVSILTIEAKCPGYLRETSGDRLLTISIERLRELNKCAARAAGQSTPLRASDWATNAPVHPWFGSLLNSSILLVSIVGLSALWHLLFRNRPERT